MKNSSVFNFFVWLFWFLFELPLFILLPRLHLEPLDLELHLELQVTAYFVSM